MEVLLRHDFPGKVRELENIIEHAFVLCRGGTIGLEHLPGELRAQRSPEPQLTPTGPSVSPVPAPGTAASTSLSELERTAIQAALQKHNSNKSLAAKELGIHRLRVGVSRLTALPAQGTFLACALGWGGIERRG